MNIIRPLRTHGWHEGAVLYRAVPEVGRVAQRDRASAFEAEGCRFELCRGRQTKRAKKEAPRRALGLETV
jgi:hypothetical protein